MRGPSTPRHWSLGKPLTAKQNLELLRQYHDSSGFQARHLQDALVRGNQCLILPWVRKYGGRRVDECDLWQEGNIGLLRAINGFDLERDRAFSSYATPAIRNQILNCIRTTATTIRLPNYVPETEAEHLKIARSCQSLDALTPSGIPRKSLLSWEPRPWDQSDYLKHQNVAVCKAIESLPRRQQEVMLLRFGFLDGREYSVIEIAEADGVRENGVHQAVSLGSKAIRMRLSRLIA